MGKVMFYHLTRHPVEVTLTMLLVKARAAGWRVLVRGTSRDRMEALDASLWQGGDESFLPHGLDGGPHDNLQPILLSAGSTQPDGFSCVMSVDGAAVKDSEVAASERVCVLFDGHDPEAVQVARAQWKYLADAGAEAEYWSEEGGGWQKKAETKSHA